MPEVPSVVNPNAADPMDAPPPGHIFHQGKWIPVQTPTESAIVPVVAQTPAPVVRVEAKPEVLPPPPSYKIGTEVLTLDLNKTGPKYLANGQVERVRVIVDAPGSVIFPVFPALRMVVCETGVNVLSRFWPDTTRAKQNASDISPQFFANKTPPQWRCIPWTNIFDLGVAPVADPAEKAKA